MTELKVGDRVRVYGWNNVITGTVIEPRNPEYYQDQALLISQRPSPRTKEGVVGGTPHNGGDWGVEELPSRQVQRLPSPLENARPERHVLR